MKYATPTRILEARNYFKQNPNGEINTGFWSDPTWNQVKFKAWFLKCLNLKTGGQELTTKDYALMHDARMINDYYGKRIRNSGSGILTTKRMQARYPHINNQRFED